MLGVEIGVGGGSRSVALLDSMQASRDALLRLDKACEKGALAGLCRFRGHFGEARLVRPA